MDEFYKMDVSIFEQCVGKSKKKDTIDHVIKTIETMNVFDQMVARYGLGESKRNSTYEVMQEIILPDFIAVGFSTKRRFTGVPVWDLS